MKAETQDFLEKILTEKELQQFGAFFVKVQAVLTLATVKNDKIDISDITPLVKEMRELLITPIDRNVKKVSGSVRKLLSNVMVRMIQESSSPKRKVAEIVLNVAKSKGFSPEQAQVIAAHFYMEFVPFRIGKTTASNASKKVQTKSSTTVDLDLLEPLISKFLAGDPEGEIAELIAELLLIFKPIYAGLYEGLDESYFAPIMEAVYKSFCENHALFTPEQSLEIAKKNFVTSVF